MNKRFDCRASRMSANVCILQLLVHQMHRVASMLLVIMLVCD